MNSEGNKLGHNGVLGQTEEKGDNAKECAFAIRYLIRPMEKASICHSHSALHSILRSSFLCILFLLVCFNIAGGVLLAGQPAPYTQEALEEIGRILKEYPPPPASQEIRSLEQMRAGVDYMREIFRRAGYDYDATIRAVVQDIKNSPNRLPFWGRDRDEEPPLKGKEDVAQLVITNLIYLKSHCDYDKVNCLELFDGETYEAVKWLWALGPRQTLPKPR